MSSRNHSEDLMDIGLRHTFKNWVARKEAPAQGRERLIAAAVWQNAQPKPSNSINQRLRKNLSFGRCFKRKIRLPLLWLCFRFRLYCQGQQNGCMKIGLFIEMPGQVL